MKNGFFAFRRAAVYCLLLFLSCAAHAATITNIVFSDHFESGAVQFPAGAWTTTGTAPLDPSTPTNVVPSGGAFSAFMNTSIDRMHRNLGAEVSGTIVFTFYIFDEGTNGGTVGATRVFNELRGYAGGSGLPNGGTAASGTLAALVAAGKFNSTTLPGDVFTNTKYQGRVAFGPGTGGTTGWFNLNGPGSPSRSFGWHRFDIEVLPPGDTIRFYVDGILCRTFTGAAIETYDTVVMGPGLGSQLGGAWIDGISVAVLTTPPPINVTCPPNLNVTTASPSGQPVNYFANATGGCSPPPTLNCTPPSGSNFPLGTTTVNCSATDTCSQTANCSFTITLTPPVGTEVFVQTNTLPPAAGTYVSPAQWHQAYANGIIISNASHNRFVGPLQPPPPAGGSNTHTFNSSATFDISIDNGATFQPAIASASVTVGVGHLANQGGRDFFSTEMQSFQIQGGSLPPGVIIRESPTLSSSGSTTVRPVAGGYMTSSSFDIHTEVSTDGGASWTPGNAPIHVELRKDFTSPPVPEPTDLLPPPNDHYVSPADWHAAYAAGVIIKDVSHNFFTQSMPPPPSGGSNTHNFGSTLDLKISLDGGATFTPVRVSSPVNVSVADAGAGTFDTEMYGLTLQGGDLPPGVMVRESPTEPSRGRTRVTPVPGGTFHIDSFFDIFTEVSLDGGANWSPASNGPVHVRLEPKAPEAPFPTPTLPPPGQYVSPSDWHAYYAMGIYISKVSHLDFSQSQPPPPPGGSSPHGFNSAVQMLVSMDGGATYNPVTAPANVFVNVISTGTSDTPTTRFFDTEMLALDIQGGGLPPGLMIRESPTRASTGRTSVRQAGPGDFRISSFFDIFTELSIDGGASWHPAVSGPASVHVTTLGTPPVTITCPADVTVPSGGPGGAIVNYPAPIAGGGCSPPIVVCNPPSGSNFPNGTTSVSCTASDSCGGSANCTFNVTVIVPAQPVAEVFVTTAIFPPTNAMYIDPQTFHTLYQNGVFINDPSHYSFTGGALPPPPGVKQPHAFGSSVDVTLNIPGSGPFLLTAPAGVSVSMSNAGTAGGAQQFETEMEQLDLTGGGLPPGVMVRESPTLRSTGHSTLRPVPGGYMASSFFDIFTEISMDGGATWSPAQAPAHMQLRKDPRTVPPVDVPTDLLPPPNGSYVSPADYHAAYAAGIIIRDVSHSFFTQSQPPPASGSNTHSFNSQVDLEVSTDGGATFTHVRVGAPVTVGISRVGNGLFDTEMLSLELTGGLPGGIMLRESPTLRSGGGVAVQPNADGSFRMHSFFDIFTEISTDGGASWSPATSGPVHVELKVPVEQPAPTPDLPPLNGEYISPEKWHQLYANGIIISNASHDRFTQSTPPPPPGGSQTHGFGSRVQFDLIQPGQPPLQVTASAAVQTHVSSSLDSGNTRYFDTEMLSLNIGGGSLPGGVIIRESPTRPSLGRTSIRGGLPDGSYRIGSFFDVFTEISLDGGATWSPAVSGPVTMTLNVPSNAPVTIACPPNMIVAATSPMGATVNYAPPTVGGGCTPPNVVCNPPSGSTMPVGITIVNCTASDTCGSSVTCSFQVIVRAGDPCVEVDNGTGTVTLPPAGCQYLSPNDVHMIIDGLPPGTTISLGVSHRGFFCDTNGSAVCSFPPGNKCIEPGGSLGGEKECSSSILAMNLTGNGLLAGFNRAMNLPISFETHIGPRTPGQPSQSFPTDMFRLFGQITGDPDFDLLRIVGGTDFGLPSPGHTTLTQLPGNTWAVDSFFDITYRIDFVGSPGGALAGRSGSTTGTIRMSAAPVTNTPVAIVCPANMSVPASGPGGAVVNYPAPTPSGGCTPPTVVCNPPSGSNFPVGTTAVTCTASDTCGGSANCTFDVTVTPPVVVFPPPVFVPTPHLPPTNGVYISPATFHQLYANGIIIRDVKHNRFTGGTLPPPPGGSLTHNFGSMVSMEVSLDGGVSFQPHTAPATVSTHVASAGQSGNIRTFDTEMLQLSISGGTLPAGVMVRESPTLASTGGTRLSPEGSGHMVSSFFDVFTELSLDGGATWSPAQSSTRVELRKDPTTIPPMLAPTGLLPPPNGQYISPQRWHALYANGIIISNASHRRFTQGFLPPASGSQNHSFGSDVSFQLSLDGGQSFISYVGPCDASVEVTRTGSDTFDTEMLALSLSGGNLPPGLMIRESPTRRSTGGTALRNSGLPPGDPDFDLLRVHSFFDIFTEISLDGGMTWSPNTNGPVQMELAPIAPEKPFPTNTLPPLNGQYVSPQQWHALFAQGIIISNVSHQRFLSNTPPPPPGGSVTHTFGSQVNMMLSLDNGATFSPVSTFADVTTHVSSSQDEGGTRYFDTEMLALNLNGGGLPAGVMVRESPTRASAGKTSLREAAPGDHRISSFFDIFIELSVDGGATWSESLGGAATVTLDNLTNTPVSIICPPDQNAQATGPSGVVVNYPPPTVGGGCTPPNVVCNPPSGSTFPVGTTTVTCTASDSCGSSATCTFNVTVSPPPPPPALEIFFRTNRLPPLDGVYISPALFHQLYQNGIIIRDIRHARFTQNLPPPPPGPGQTHSFDSVVELEASTDGGLSYQKFSAPAAVVTHVVRQGATDTFDTEMLQLNVAGGNLPPGVMVRESPTQASAGQTTVRPVPGGYMIGSFFDIFTELSLDGGASWVPAVQTTRVELRRDPRTAPPQNVPSNRLPPRNGAYVSPAEWHQAYANGIVISNISHARFTDTLPPPPPGDSQTHQFNSHIDLMLSQDGGATYVPVRVNAVVDVGVVSRSSSPGQGTFDTEMLAMSLSGGGLPPGVMIRESPTLPSRGGVQMDQQADGTFHVSSFFDIFTELSVDGGNNWQPATTGPARVELRNQATEKPFPTSELPPPTGQYVSPQQWHALFANGIIISNVSHQRFMQSQPPPPPGGTNQHTFGSTVNMLLSMNGGASFTPVSASASVGVRVGSTEDDGDTRFFDTEMLQLSLEGGSLPPGVMIRESPTRQSTGGTSMRQPQGQTGFQIASFFDIFLEVSTDGGATWSPSLTGPSHVSLDTLTANPCAGPSALTVERSPDGTSVIISWIGAGFRLQCTEVLESNSAATVWVDVPGASPVTQPIVPGKNKFYRVICP